MRAISILFIPIIMFFSYKDAVKLIPITIKGVVLDAQSGKPLPGVYVYVVKGEEESLTDAKGAFTLESWQPLPLQLTVQYADASVKNVRVSSVNKPLQILVSTR